MNNINLNDRLVRYGELIPCKTAFIDTHTPGSNQKENFSIIGSGVSENPDQHVHIKIPHGFNIGAAGQPPKCHNSLHSHRTAEVFFVFWGFGFRGLSSLQLFLLIGNLFVAYLHRSVFVFFVPYL